jgi:hypothetical protein
MSTRRQRAASRANAQKSTGPRTTEGKAASRFNALKHGIDAQQQTMFGESAEDLAALAAEYHELHAPANADERFLVDSMVNYEWRLRRLRGVEASLWLTAAKDTRSSGGALNSGGAFNISDAFNNGARAFDRLQRMVNSCERHYHRARKELQAAQAARADSQTAPQAQETAATSGPSASFRTNPPSAPEMPTADLKITANSAPNSIPDTVPAAPIAADRYPQAAEAAGRRA